MEIRSTHIPPLAWAGDTLAVGIPEGSTEIAGELAELDEKLGGNLRDLLAETAFDAQPGSVVSTRLGGASPVRKLILVGLGKESELTPQTLREAGATLVRAGKQQKSKVLAVSLPTSGDTATDAAAVTEGAILGSHQDNRFKSEAEDKGTTLERVELLGWGERSEAIARAEQICSGVILARELVNAPANAVTPGAMAEVAGRIASEHPGLSLEILERDDCEYLGMGAFLGVARASELPPKFIHLTYKPSGKPKSKVAIVGKSLTFDSGGLNIKGAGSGIETMKMDMGGGAATLGAARVIAKLRPEVEVHFICAATENMISGRALHPGDILTASNGKTIEVNNTDAEGRLTLADALVFAEKLEVEAIVDLATLTGACVVALGEDIGGLWANDETLAGEIEKAAGLAGEKLWRMPLEEKYFEGLKSSLADLKNTGPRPGGSITAALFLKQFVKNTPWVHLDIAGPVWADKEKGVNNAGATGFPVRTLVNWILARG